MGEPGTRGRLSGREALPLLPAALGGPLEAAGVAGRAGLPRSWRLRGAVWGCLEPGEPERPPPGEPEHGGCAAALMRQVTLRAERAGTPGLACPWGRLPEHRNRAGRAAGLRGGAGPVMVGRECSRWREKGKVVLGAEGGDAAR